MIKNYLKKYSNLRRFYRVLRDFFYFTQEPKFTVHGFKFIGNKAMEEGNFELIETDIFKKLLPKIDLLLNIGANVGYYASLALHQGKNVIAFEPIEQNLKLLMKNICANNWQNRIEIFPLALTNEAGILKIYGNGTGASLVPGWAKIPTNDFELIPCSTANTVLNDRLNNQKILIVADIEGSEKKMLDGASKLLSMIPKPIWMIEISITEHLPEEMKINPDLLPTFELFWKHGYMAITADKKLKTVHRNEIAYIVETGINTLNTHNFLFIDEDNFLSIFDTLHKS